MVIFKTLYLALFVNMLPSMCIIDNSLGSDTLVPEYEISCAGYGVEGTYLAKVSVLLPKPNEKVLENLRMAAVHGVIFKGLPASINCDGYRPFVSNPDALKNNADYFQSLFSDSYMSSYYASVLEGTLNVSKIKKKLYKITATVSIKKDSLRRKLEQDGIIKGFSDLF